MADTAPEISAEAALRQLSEQARAVWGAGYVEQNRALLEQAAQYMAEIANNLPDKETEPGFYQ